MVGGNRLVEEKVKNIDRYFTTKKNEERRIQKILDVFKENVTEKLRLLTDDFT